MVPSTDERANSPIQDWVDSPTQVGTGGSGKPQPMSVGPTDPLIFLALMRQGAPCGPLAPRRFRAEDGTK